eukprot:2937402-Prymnesium_polylepis.2
MTNMRCARKTTSHQLPYGHARAEHTVLSFETTYLFTRLASGGSLKVLFILLVEEGGQLNEASCAPLQNWASTLQ